MLRISQAETKQALDDVRALMRAFLDWQAVFNAADIALINRYFDADAYEAEMAGLPGSYAPPKGSLLIAHSDDTPAGCVAMKDLGDGICEMKRMFVPVEFHGTGTGRALAERIVEDARNAGYRSMRLDTSWRQVPAQKLYESLGFRPIEPYYDMPEEMKAFLVFRELDLKA